MIPTATSEAAPSPASPTCSFRISQPRNTPKIGVRKEKLATEAAGYIDRSHSQNMNPADTTTTTTDDLLSRIAGVDPGPIRAQLAQTGQALCPALVQPASTIASNAAEMQGHGGLTPTIAGIAAAPPDEAPFR